MVPVRSNLTAQSGAGVEFSGSSLPFRKIKVPFVQYSVDVIILSEETK